MHMNILSVVIFNHNNCNIITAYFYDAPTHLYTTR